METKPPLPPFTEETAIQKVRMAEDAWNSRDPERVAQVYTLDTLWRNRTEFPKGRDEVRQFLTRKWARELDYRLIKELWGFRINRMAVRFAYEWRDDSGSLVPLLRQRELGVRRQRPDAAPLRQHQRPADRRAAAAVPLAARAPARRSSGLERTRPLGAMSRFQGSRH